MSNAVIVSTARTGFGKSWRGAFNMTYGATLGGHVVQQAVARAGIDPAEVEDVLMGCALTEGTTGGNIARQIALRAGLPESTGGVTVNRFCSSGLQTIRHGGATSDHGESAGDRRGRSRLDLLRAERHEQPDAPGSLAERARAGHLLVDDPDRRAGCEALRYFRERQDEYGVRSQKRAAEARAAGKFDDEIAPMKVTMGVVDEATSRLSTREMTISSDEGIRPDTTIEGVSKIRTVLPDGVITAGNASQFSDGASACVVMDEKLAEKRGLKPLGIFRGFAVAGCDPKEMGIGPVFAVPRLLERTGCEAGGCRPVGAQRSVRRASDLLPRSAWNPG